MLRTSVFNKLSLEVSQRRAVERTSSTTYPGVLIPGVALEIEDGILFQRKRHLIQVGAGVNRIALRTQVLDGSRGLFAFPTLATLTSGSADFFTQSFGAPTQTWPKSA